MPETAREYDIVIGTCSDIFTKKMHDYGLENFTADIDHRPNIY